MPCETWAYTFIFFPSSSFCERRKKRVENKTEQKKNYMYIYNKIAFAYRERKKAESQIDPEKETESIRARAMWTNIGYILIWDTCSNKTEKYETSKLLCVLFGWFLVIVRIFSSKAAFHRLTQRLFHSSVPNSVFHTPSTCSLFIVNRYTPFDLILCTVISWKIGLVRSFSFCRDSIFHLPFNFRTRSDLNFSSSSVPSRAILVSILTFVRWICILTEKYLLIARGWSANYNCIVSKVLDVVRENFKWEFRMISTTGWQKLRRERKQIPENSWNDKLMAVNGHDKRYFWKWAIIFHHHHRWRFFTDDDFFLQCQFLLR